MSSKRSGVADRITLYDTTLRDGAQSQGVDFSVADKVAIAEALDSLGVDYIEGGWPGANPTDDAFFGKPPGFRHARLAAFGMTRRPGRSAANDPGLAALLNVEAPVVCMVGKTWDYHVDVALGIEREENLAMIRDSVVEVAGRGREAIFDCEHFFDGFASDPGYALACAEAALEGGARWIVLCDTNGGSLPAQVERAVAAAAERIPGARLGIHTHNDSGLAEANSLIALEAGCRQVQGTLNGLGERCCNANLVTLIGTIALKTGWKTAVDETRLQRLTHVSHLLDERLNRSPARNAPYVGTSAFAHKGGLHVSAVEKNPRTYEHIDPEAVGNHRTIVVSDQSGRSNILARLREVGIDLGHDRERTERLVDEVKRREFDGFAYDGAEASFELLARRALEQVPEYFSLDRFRVMDDRRWSARGDLVTESEATVSVKVAGRSMMTVANGNGPVNALDSALRKALLPVYPSLEDMRLIDYKVRILTPQAGTAAVTRVMIESADASGRHWTSVGVSPNIIDASFNALHDGITWKLLSDGAAVPAAA